MKVIQCKWDRILINRGFNTENGFSLAVSCTKLRSHTLILITCRHQKPTKCSKEKPTECFHFLRGLGPTVEIMCWKDTHPGARNYSPNEREREKFTINQTFDSLESVLTYLKLTNTTNIISLVSPDRDTRERKAKQNILLFV